MKASVVIPCHNAERYIGETLRSVAAQTQPAHEVFVINDRSADGSAEAVEASGVPVTLLNTDFGNAAAARNAGIERATGDWVAFLDADDYWRDNHLETAAGLLARGDAVAFMANRDLIDDSGAVRQQNVGLSLQDSEPNLPADRFPGLFRGNGFYFAMSSCLMRTDRLRAIDGLDVGQVRRHDIDMWLRGIAGHTWAYSVQPTSVYRIDTPGAISRNVSDREYWFLRAMLKNRSAFPGPDFDAIVRLAARRAVSAGLTDGTATDVKRAIDLANDELSPTDRWVYRAARVAPWAFASLNRWRRRAATRHRAAHQPLSSASDA